MVLSLVQTQVLEDRSIKYSVCMQSDGRVDEFKVFHETFCQTLHAAHSRYIFTFSYLSNAPKNPFRGSISRTFFPLTLHSA